MISACTLGITVVARFMVPPLCDREIVPRGILRGCAKLLNHRVFLGRPEFPRPSVQTMFHDYTQQGLSINAIARRPRMRNGGWSNQSSAQQSRAVLYSH